MTRRPLPLAAALAAVLALAACAEKPQTASGRKLDDKPWDNSNPAHAAPGLKPGDQAAWEQQLKARNQAQNEYSRTGSH